MGGAVVPNLSGFKTQEDALGALVERLVAGLDPQSVWLFGSRARGNARPDSDFDILVVAKPEGHFGSDDYEVADKCVRDLRIGCDIVPCAAADFQDGLALATSFVAQVVREGRRLFHARVGDNYRAK